METVSVMYASKSDGSCEYDYHDHESVGKKCSVVTVYTTMKSSVIL